MALILVTLAAIWVVRLAIDESAKRASEIVILKDKEVRELNKALAEAHERLIYQLTMMKREGFATIPEDEPFETYALTPEMEADIEDSRNREG